MVKSRVRALIRKGLVEHAHISFKGEFSALRDWTKDEFTNPTPLERGDHRPLRLQAAVEESLVAAAELDAQVAGR